MYTLYRQSLLRWHYVEELPPTNLQERFLTEHGVWAHRWNLHKWVTAPAQALPTLENNEDIHSHACGEFVLGQNPSGVRPAEVVSSLLKEYLVKTTARRVQA